MSDSKAGRGCGIRDKENSPKVPQKEEQSRCTDINQAKPTVSTVIAGRVHRNKASLMVRQDIKLARVGRDHCGKRPGAGIRATQLR